MSNNDLKQLVTVEYRDNARIQIININDMTRKAVDAFIEVIKTEMINREESLVLSVHNYDKVGSIVSPYFLGQMKEIGGDDRRTELYGRVAVVTSVDIFRLLLNPVVKIFTLSNKKLAIQFFATVDEAVEWVSEYEE